jgi:DNA-binding NtrC family response regulator
MADAVLIADDEIGVRESLAEVLRDEGYVVTAVADGAAALEAVEEGEFAVVVVDIRMPGADGLAVLRRVREISPQTVVIVMTAHASVETAVEALHNGAADYVLKPVLFEDMLVKVARAIEHRRLAWQSQMLRREVDRRYDPGGLVGTSPGIEEIRRLAAKVAPTNTTVLITGESGTGKEVVARLIFAESTDHGAIFLPINCAAIPDTLLESQLFGHVRGAFTGAVAAQGGLFERARGGTIFLDEIGDLPLGLQTKLLRAIETREVLPVGGTTPRPIDVRIIAASNRNLGVMVEQGTFRDDLYYRLNVIEIVLPPLRDRPEDIPALVEFLVARHNRDLKTHYRGVDGAAMKILLAQRWRGNVRELDNVLERAMILGDGEWIRPVDLPSAMGESAGPEPTDDLRAALRSYERVHIATVLRSSDGDKRVAAARLGLSLSSLYRKLTELDLAAE